MAITDPIPVIELFTDFYSSDYYYNLNYLKTQSAHLSRSSLMTTYRNGVEVIYSKFRDFINNAINGADLCPFCHDLFDFGHTNSSSYKNNPLFLIHHSLNIGLSKEVWNKFYEELRNEQK